MKFKELPKSVKFAIRFFYLWLVWKLIVLIALFIVIMWG